MLENGTAPAMNAAVTTRRRFTGASLAGLARAQMPLFDRALASGAMRTSETMVSTADGEMLLYEAAPDGDRHGAIVVIQEAFGVNAHIQDVTRRAAAAGYHAVAPDLFHRSGPGSVVEYGNFEKVMEYFKDVSGDDAVLTDVDAALAHLRAAGHADSRVGVVGLCLGGLLSV